MSAAAVQTLDISPVGRVEGALDVRVDIQDGVIVNSWTRAELFRGFEVILRDKDPQAGLVVKPRACGICGASHLTCAAWALDTAWATTVPRNAILARNLGQLVESLQSLPRHHYGLFMIDFTNKNHAKSPYYAEAVRRWAPFTGTNYEIGVTISGRPVEIYALLGGQWPHSSYMVPSGVMCAPTLTDVTRAWSILEHFRRNWIEPIWLGCSMERDEEIKSYDDFLAWLDEKPGGRMPTERFRDELRVAVETAEDPAIPAAERAETPMEIAIGLQVRPKSRDQLEAAVDLNDRALQVCPPEKVLLAARIRARKATALQAVPDGGSDHLAAARRELEAYRDLADRPRPILDAMLRSGTNAPLASSCGRLFDAVAAAVGICRERQGYEGEAAARLEAIVDRQALHEEPESLAYPFAVPRLRGSGLPYIEPRAVWNAILGDLLLGTSPGIISARFHRGLARAIAAMTVRLAARDAESGARFDTVALSGGCFHNELLRTEVERLLADQEFDVLTHSAVPAGDGGLALGQAAIDAARLMGGSTCASASPAAP